MSLSTSANSVRTLHRSSIEEERERDIQGVEQCAHCSATTTPPMEPTSVPTTAATLVFHSGGPESMTSSLVLPSPPDSPNLSPLHSAAHSPFLSSAESESSLPSVSSSFFFSSSAPGSPGRSRNTSSYPSSYPHSEHEHDHETGIEIHRRSRRQGHNLIIPSLALPSALRRPTPFGQTLGQLKVLVLGAQGVGKSFLTGLLLEDNEDVIEVGSWESWDPDSEASGVGNATLCYGKVLHASTDYVEHTDAFGLERYEPTKNVQIVELPPYDHETDPNELVSQLKSIIERPFRSLHGVLHPNTAPSDTIAAMLASPTSPLYTAMIFLLPSSPTPLDMQIISSLSGYIPLIVLPRLQGAHPDSTSSGSSSAASSPAFPPSYRQYASQSAHTSQAKLSSFKPTSAVTLRTGLFHSPETLALLRKEGVDRFLKWREIERELDQIGDGGESVLRKRRFGEREWGRTAMSVSSTITAGPPRLDRHASTSSISSSQSNMDATLAGTLPRRSTAGWNKAQWEAEWMTDHSKDVDVARKLRRGSTVRGKRPLRERDETITERSTAKLPLKIDERSSPMAIAEESSSESRSVSSLQLPTPADDDPPSPSLPDVSPPPPIAFDPLHIPSMLLFSVSLLGPLKDRFTQTLSNVFSVVGSVHVFGVDFAALTDAPGLRIALLGAGGFCVGLGVGVLSTRG